MKVNFLKLINFSIKKLFKELILDFCKGQTVSNSLILIDNRLSKEHDEEKNQNSIKTFSMMIRQFINLVSTVKYHQHLYMGKFNIKIKNSYRLHKYFNCLDLFHYN